eukprot:TRINITY_DN11557_c0_g1_i2.p1 TRINITY_DN11557_c0_g1~~TRINITY_DN11557_c0_g1_i2.p1  ORF type:complete len:116 (+),score=6.35 TRINITY_DN11557_c0_g1_i2:143-490(+)
MFLHLHLVCSPLTWTFQLEVLQSNLFVLKQPSSKHCRCPSSIQVPFDKFVCHLQSVHSDCFSYTERIRYLMECTGKRNVHLKSCSNLPFELIIVAFLVTPQDKQMRRRISKKVAL